MICCAPSLRLDFSTAGRERPKVSEMRMLFDFLKYNARPLRSK